MPRQIKIDGQIAIVPDDATDEEINYLFPAKSTVAPSTNGVTIGAAANSENPITNYFKQVGNDLTQGGARTGIGRMLGTLQGRQQGYSGLNSGVSEGAANIMGSTLTGMAQALEGLASIPQHPISGPIKSIGGVLKAMTIPSMVVGGPGATAAIDAFPSARFAGSQLNQIAEAVGNADVPLNRSLAPLQRLAELNARGGSGSVPAGVMQLLDRSQAIAPMAYPEARDFVSNVSALSTAEKLASKPQVLSQMGGLRAGLHADIADSLGDLGPNYLEAIKEYAKAQQIKQAAARVAKVGIGAGAAGIIGKGAYDLSRKISGN